MNPEFTDWIKEIRARLIQQGFIKEPAAAAKIANENQSLTYARERTDPTV
jgi:hypothetical protein